MKVYLDTAYCWKLKTENTVVKNFLNVWIVPWDPILKKNLMKSVLAGLVNSAWDPLKKTQTHTSVVFSAIQTYT